jgi:hypothetical protein
VHASRLKPVAVVVDTAQRHFRTLLASLATSGGLSRDQYVRYLQFQYHLTRDVQRAFLCVAGHSHLSDRRSLREFLFDFALEEEPHYSIAERDLAALGATPGVCPLEVKLWWAYWSHEIPAHPFARLGATCVLENLGAGAGPLGKQLLCDASFITPDNSRFIQIHFHEALPHGDQVYNALNAVSLRAIELADLRRGACEGAQMYLRMARWALQVDATQRELDACFDES